MKNLYQKIFLAFLLSSGAAISIAGQDLEEIFPTRQPDEFADARPEYCWKEEEKLGSIGQWLPKDKTLTIIARRGASETRSEINQRRLHNVRAYLTQYQPKQLRRDPEKIILSEGEPIEGYGALEFYLDGRLIEVFKMRKDADLRAFNCYIADDKSNRLFYPYRDKLIKRKRKTLSNKNRR